MEAFKTVKGVVLPIDRSNVDTDAIIPKQYLKSVARTGFARVCRAWGRVGSPPSPRVSVRRFRVCFLLMSAAVADRG